MEFRLLGPLEVVDGGQLVPIPSAKHRALLAYLLVRPGELVTVDELAEVIWGDALPANPRTTVQTYVSRLRQRLHLGEVLRSRPDGYVLVAACGDIDLGRFEILLEQASRAAGAGDRQGEAALLRQALALWRGVPLADVPSELLQRNVVLPLVEQRLSALQRRIEADLELGRHAEVVAELRALTDQYPLRERYRALLMLALYRCGRQADALQAYQRARRVLADELGIGPGPELRGLHRAVLTNDPALAVPPAAVGGDGGVRPSQLPLDVAHVTASRSVPRRSPVRWGITPPAPGRPWRCCRPATAGWGTPTTAGARVGRSSPTPPRRLPGRRLSGRTCSPPSSRPPPLACPTRSPPSSPKGCSGSSWCAATSRTGCGSTRSPWRSAAGPVTGPRRPGPQRPRHRLQAVRPLQRGVGLPVGVPGAVREAGRPSRPRLRP